MKEHISRLTSIDVNIKTSVTNQVVGLAADATKQNTSCKAQGLGPLITFLRDQDSDAREKNGTYPIFLLRHPIYRKNFTLVN